MNSKSSQNYKLHAKLNGKTFDIESSNLKDAFKTLKENVSTLKTKIFLSIESNEGYCNMVVMLKKGRMMFNNSRVMDVFINNLIFKSNAIKR